MPIGPSSVHVNAALTNVAMHYRSPEFVLDQVFPTVPTMKKSDSYYIFTKDFWFKNEADERVNNGMFPRVEFETSNTTFNCKHKGLAVEVPDDMVDNADPAVDPYTNSTNLSMDGVLRNREITIATALTTTANWSTTARTIGAGDEWDTATGGDPVADIKYAINAVRASIGRLPNTAVMSWKVWWALRFNPILRAYFSGGADVQKVAILNAAILQEMFQIPRWIVTPGIYATNKEGATFAASDVMTDTAWFGYVSPSPSAIAPSAGYVFEWKGRRVITYREDAKGQDVVEASSAYDVKVTAGDAGVCVVNCLA